MEDTEHGNAGMQVRYFDVPQELDDFFRSFVLLDVSIPDGEVISDLMLPLWGNLSWRDRTNINIRYQSGETINAGLTGLIGPHDHAVQAIVGPVRQWTAVLKPGAWARCIDAPARSYTNRIAPIIDDSAFSAFHGLDRTLFSGEPDDDAEFERIKDVLMPLANLPPRKIENWVGKIMAAVSDGDITRVSTLADSLGISRRTLERICDDVFGLPPKTLLLRQRFLRSVGHHMIKSDRPWIDSLDQSYHDQAQFVREFRRIMGVTPSELARMDRPLQSPFLIENVRAWQEIEERSDQRAS
ncbi:MAG: helix-turn-helix domain-containing protein [Sphingomonadaceae bacterium]|nr:helix-turn-helix domain-containing protein [Sphingomonadaceae bacterium]